MWFLKFAGEMVRCFEIGEETVLKMKLTRMGKNRIKVKCWPSFL